jgi:hypothetical protein
MQEYKSSKTMKVFTLIMCSAILLWLVYILSFILLHHSGHPPHDLRNWLAVSFVFVVFLSVIFVLGSSLWSKLSIGEDSISFVSPFKRWEINLSEIRGYRIRDKFLLIEPLSKNQKRIDIRRSNTGTAELLTLLESKYEDLDLVEKEEGHKAILDNPRYGKSPELRKERLDDATAASKLINATGVLILLLSFISRIDKYMVALAIAAPFIFILVIRLYHGLISIGKSTNSAYPSIPFGLSAILVCLIAKCVHYKVLDHQNIWQPAFLVGTLVMAFLMLGNKNFSRSWQTRFMGILVIAICSYVYGFSTIVAVNCVYDHSTSRHYQTRVMDKWVRHSRGSRYNFKLARWRNAGGEEIISVSRQMYERLNIDDPMHIYVHRGLLQIPWYEIYDQQKIANK